MNNFLVSESSEMLTAELESLVGRFPYLTVRYEYDVLSDSHCVEVRPKDAYQNDEAYIEAEMEISDRFDQLFPGQCLYFISEDALVGVKNPIWVYRASPETKTVVPVEIIPAGEIRIEVGVVSKRTYDITFKRFSTENTTSNFSVEVVDRINYPVCEPNLAGNFAYKSDVCWNLITANFPQAA